MNESNNMENISPEMLGIMINHLQKVATQPEEEQLNAWLKEDSQNLARFEEVSGIWNLTASVEDSFQPDVNAAWQNVKAKTISFSHAGSIPTEGKVLSFPQLFMSAAASLLLLIGFGFLLQSALQNEPTWTTVATTNEKRQVFLPDSSSVWLNRNSHLSWSDFKGDFREVKLDGEAFFEVSRHPEQPFRITGRESITEVLGTSFNLKSVSGSGDKLVVVTGRVAFSSINNLQSRMEFLPGQKGEIEKEGIVKQSAIENTNFRAWQTQQLSFNNTGLMEVADALESYFSIRIEIKNDNLKNCRFTGSFEKPVLKDVIQVLSESVNLKSEYQDSTYFLTGSGCP